MNVDELRAGFARLAEPVVPVEDPYGRLLDRARRSRRARFTGWLSGLAAVVVAVLVTPLLVQASGNPSPAPSPGVDDIRGADITGWVRQLMDTPVRGSLAGDTAFATALTDRLTPRYFGFSPELDQQTVLFAGDVGGYRAVLIAFHSHTKQMGVWLVGDAGASAEKLATAGPANLAMLPGSGTPRAGGTSPVTVLPGELQPFSATAVGGAAAGRYLAIGVAPEGCRVATKDASHPQTWHDEATGDYVARTDPLGVDMSTYVKVTCEGVVRYQAPITNNARIEVGPPSSPTDHQVDAAMTGVRGTPPDRAVVRRILAEMGLGSSPAPPFDDCRVLYNGPVPGSVDSSPAPGGTVREPPLLVAACTTGHGNTQFAVAVDGATATGGYTRMKLGDPHAVFAVNGLVLTQTTTQRSDGTTTHEGSSVPSDRLLVLAPPAAVRLEVLQSGQVTQSVPMAAGVGAITLPLGATAQVRALDGSGAVVGTGTAPTADNVPEELPAVSDPVVDNWK